MAIEANKVIAVNFMVSYPHFKEPQKNDKGEEFFNCVLISTEESNLQAVKDMVMRFAVEKFGDRAAEMFRTRKLKSPFRTDVESKGYPEGATFFSCKSKSKPDIVGVSADPRTGKPALYTGEVRPGMIVNASLRAYWYPQQGGGIAIGLGNVQVTNKPFTPLDNRLPASDEFDAEEAANADAADLGDVL